MSSKFTSLIVVGFIIAAATTSAAYLNDTIVSEDNTFQAGSIVLDIGYETIYNDQQIEQEDPTTDPGTIFNFGDMKPGDNGVTTISTEVSDNDGWKWIMFDQTNSEGQLAENTQVGIFYDQNGDGELDENDEYIYQGSLANVEDTLGDGFLLDADPQTEDEEPFEAGEEYYISFGWSIPETVQNVDGDVLVFDMEFYAEQARNNPDPDNPWQ